MSWVIEKTSNLGLAHKAWEYYSSLPDGLIIFGSGKDAFVSQILKDTNFALFENGSIKAIVNAVDLGNFIVEGHIYCPRTASISHCAAAILFAKEWLFAETETKAVVAHVHRRHTGLQKIIRQSGFDATGILANFQAADKKPFRTEMWIAAKEKL